MCEIRYFYVIFPDGHRERRQRREHCDRGTRHSLCKNVREIDNFDERLATQAEIEEQTGPVYQVIAPRDRQTEEHGIHDTERRGRSRRTKNDNDSLDGLAVELKGWELFRYFFKTKKSPTRKSKLVLIREKENESRPSSRRTATPDRHRQHSPSPYPRSRSPHTDLRSHLRRSPREPRIVQIEPKAVKESAPGGKKSQGRKSPPKPVEIHQTDRRRPSASPPTPTSGREHSRPTSAMYTTTGISKYEAEKEKQRQKELQEDRERRRYAQDKREEDKMVAEAKRAIAEAKAKDEEDRRRKERRVAEQESAAHRRARRLAEEEKDAEAERRRRSEDDDRRRAAADERHQRPRRGANYRSSYHANPREGETDAQMRARIKQHEDDIRKIRDTDRRKGEQEAKDHDRGDRKGNPRRPRQTNTVHNPSSDDDLIEEDEDEESSYDRDDFDARGDHFFRDAIRTEERQEAERRAQRDQWRQPYSTDEGMVRETWDGTQVEVSNGPRRRKRRDSK